MFTASHNPCCDNGVKIIRPNGEMLHQEEEKLLTNFVNEFDLEKALTLLEEKYCVKFKDLNSVSTGLILIGHDTRESCQDLIMHFFKGLIPEIVESQIIYAGMITTP